MDGYLRQSTASQVRTIGPFLDDVDFKTEETALTIANTDVKLLKNGAASVNKNSGGATHLVNGNYTVTWNATDTDTVGHLRYSVKVAGALQVWGDYLVVEEAVYDINYVAAAPGYASPFKKNTAFSNFTFAMGATGLTVTLVRSIDGGTALAAANAVTEVATASKMYKVNLAATDLNGDIITFKATASGQPDVFWTIRTSP